jgi:hypothetical protein
MVLLCGISGELMTQELKVETNMTILEDLATTLRSIAKDALPMVKWEAKVLTNPERLEFRVPNQKGLVIWSVVQQLGASLKAFTDEHLSSLDIQVLAIEGSEASGLEVTIKGGKYPYFHIVHRNDLRLTKREG